MEQKITGVISDGDENGETDKVKSEILAGAESCRNFQAKVKGMGLL